MDKNIRLVELEKMINSMYLDFGKFFDKKNKSAGIRIRKNLQDLKKKTQELRIEILEMIKIIDA